MYKIRSMKPNAEAEKEMLQSQNRVSDGMMFKIEWDPRVIGNHIDENGTKKTGIGEFIRKTSLDEFPQFFNVLKGDMSLVGTRPPTPDEWEKYAHHHRARLATKPGVTGMWQVSGRSEIKDFEEVVKLDTEYISNWSIGLDIKILLKTFGVVVKGRGNSTVLYQATQLDKMILIDDITMPEEYVESRKKGAFLWETDRTGLLSDFLESPEEWIKAKGGA